MANVKISDLPLINGSPLIPDSSVFPVVRNNVTYKMTWDQIQNNITASGANPLNITGTGTTNFIPKWTTGGSVIENSVISDVAGAVTVAGAATFTSSVSLESTSPLLYLNNTTVTTGKNWRLSSAANGKLFISHEGVVDAITLEPTTGAATFSGGVTLSATTNVITIPSLTDNGTFLDVTQTGNEQWFFKCESIGGGSLDYVTIGANGGGKVAFGEDGSAIFEGNLKVEKSLDGDPQLLFVTNPNSGTATEAAIYVGNAALGATSATTFMQTLGTGFSSTGGFIQDGSVIGTGTDISGGLSLMVRANADMRFYTNGHTNQRMIITSGGNVGIGTDNPTGLTGKSLVVSSGIGEYAQVMVERTNVGFAGKYGMLVGNDGSFLLRNYTTGGNVITISPGGGAVNFNGSILVNEPSPNYAPSLRGQNYTVTAGGAGDTQINCFTGILPESGIYDIFVKGNPNSSGSGVYASTFAGYISIACDFISGDVQFRISQATIIQDGGGSGNLQLVVTCTLYNSANNTSSLSQPTSAQSTTQILVNVSGYSRNAGANQDIRIVKRL